MLVNLRWLCWLPLVTLAATELYVGRFDGWGAWAASPVLLVPAFVSLVVVLIGAYDCRAAYRAGRLGPVGPVYTIIAGLPLVWLLVRRLLA